MTRSPLCCPALPAACFARCCLQVRWRTYLNRVKAAVYQRHCRPSGYHNTACHRRLLHVTAVSDGDALAFVLLGFAGGLLRTLPFAGAICWCCISAVSLQTRPVMQVIPLLSLPAQVHAWCSCMCSASLDSDSGECVLQCAVVIYPAVQCMGSTGTDFVLGATSIVRVPYATLP